jgi:hypothetical protein
MFYEENEINKLLICPSCNLKFLEPKLLPCGKSVCIKCVESMLELYNDNENKNEKRLQCLFCSRSHLVTEDELPSSEMLELLLKKEPSEVYRGDLAKELKELLSKIKTQTFEIRESIENGIEKI